MVYQNLLNNFKLYHLPLLIVVIPLVTHVSIILPVLFNYLVVIIIVSVT